MNKLIYIAKKFAITRQILTLLSTIRIIYNTYFNITRFSNYGFRDKTSIVRTPGFFDPKYVFLHEQTRLSTRTRIVSSEGKFIMKKYSVASLNLLVITCNHIPTVGVPCFQLGVNHINDKITDIVVEEDVWLGANVTLLPGAHLGRGSYCAANTLVNKPIPPYAIVAGTPGKIIGTRFNVDQIITHERLLYPLKERYSEEFLRSLFSQNFVGLKSMGLSTMSELDAEILHAYRQKHNL